MNSKRIIGLILFIAGVALIAISGYIKNQVAQGNLQISSAQQKVDSGNSFFSFNPIAKQVGQGMTSGAQSKINAGKEQVAHYTEMAQTFQIGGIALVVIGGLMLVFCSGRKK